MTLGWPSFPVRLIVRPATSSHPWLFALGLAVHCSLPLRDGEEGPRSATTHHQLLGSLLIAIYTMPGTT